MRAFLFFWLVFFSCNYQGKILPDSTGANSEVVFVTEESLWVNSVDSLVQKTFGAQIKGINQPEPLFRVIHINHGEFKSILKKHKNIVIISEGVTSFNQKNKWANDQYVSQLNWDKDTNELFKTLIELRKVFLEKEVKSISNLISKSSQKNIEKRIFDEFGIDCLIPKEYEVIQNDNLLFWAKYDPKNSDEIKNILIFSFIPKTLNLQSEVLRKTDSVFAKNVIGEKKGTHVQIEPLYPPYYLENSYRGLWKLQNGFMGGPFLIKTYFVKNKVVVNIGFVFAPQNKKRKYIKEFEAIL